MTFLTVSGILFSLIYVTHSRVLCVRLNSFLKERSNLTCLRRVAVLLSLFSDTRSEVEHIFVIQHPGVQTLHRVSNLSLSELLNVAVLHSDVIDVNRRFTFSVLRLTLLSCFFNGCGIGVCFRRFRRHLRLRCGILRRCGYRSLLTCGSAS